MTPEFADRYRLVRGVLPPGVPHAARIVALAAVAFLFTLREAAWFSDEFETALIVLASLLAFRALYLWLRPLARKGDHTDEERVLARRVVREQGRDSLAYFALRRDKSY